MPYYSGLSPVTLDKTNTRLGINKSVPTVTVDIVGRTFISSSTFPPLFVERTTTNATGIFSGMEFRATTSGDMTDGFGTQMIFSLVDSAGTANQVSAIRFTRDGADNQASLSLLAGNLSVMMTIRASGYVGLSGITNPSSWLHLPASTTSAASLCLPHGAAPTSPVNGDIWTTTDGLYVRINGITVGPLS